MTTNAISAAKLARLACEALARQDDSGVRFNGIAKNTGWCPEVALAVAGHISQHWIHATTKPLHVAQARSSFTTVLSYTDGDRTYRLAVYGGLYASVVKGEQVLAELCGHDDCFNPAPAGPGSRCFQHTTDPTPRNEDTTYWGRIAAEAWAAHSNPHRPRADQERNGVVLGGLASGLGRMDLHKITGMSRSTIDRIIAGFARQETREPAKYPWSQIVQELAGPAVAVAEDDSEDENQAV